MNKTIAPVRASFTLVLLMTALVRFAASQDQSAKGVAPYLGWEHSGSLSILTTPEGANLPATASENGFPLLVRLDKDWFDFGQAKANGDDVRFAAASGAALAYQIDEWDVAQGKAAVWVRIPTIQGNAQQEIKMYWGNPAAKSESSGSAVFNDLNGYASVFHMNDPVADDVGTVTPKDSGTTSSSGIIGKARHFTGNVEIAGGTNIKGYAVGNDPHSTELWIRPDAMGGMLMAWGVSKPNSVVQMGLARPPHIRMDCFYSLAGIAGDSVLPLAQWSHIVHTYKPGESRLYVNGRLDHVRTGKDVSLTVGSPADLMRIGGHGYVGDIDEARISKVARSDDWIKLQYENQKPLQTAVGTLPWPGTEFSASERKLDILEGKSVTVTAKAGGARKVYWIVKNGPSETIAAVDRLSYAVAAGRVKGDQSFVLQFKAVYADGPKTIDIPVTIQEDIPEPVFTLSAPANWDGREAIGVAAQIENLDAMRAKDAAQLKYDWTVSDVAVIKAITPGKLLLKRAQNSGTMTVTATISNGGEPITRSIQIAVNEPQHDAWIERTPDKDEKPVDNQFFARDNNNEGTIFYNGTLNEPADKVFLKLYADEKLIHTERGQPQADKSYALSVKLKAGLIKYRVEFGTESAGTEKVLHTAGNLVCGDAYIINGQSNAVAYNYHNVVDRPDFFDFTSDWIRTYGTHGESGPENYANGGWGNAVVSSLIVNGRGGVRFVGCWGMTLARKLLDDQKMPICILQGAFGGTRIDQHLRDEADPENAKTIYGRLLRRVKEAKLTHGIRGVLWHQGEADQGFDGPDNCYGSEMYQQYFVDLSAAWKQDFPNIAHYYVFQIWPNACHQGGTSHSDKLRDIQRRLSRLYSHLTVMSTLGLPSGGCHFALTDYEQMGRMIAALVEQDNYRRVFDRPVTAPDLKRAYYTSEKNDEIVLEFDQPVIWTDPLAKLFCLDDKEGLVVSGIASGNTLKLQLTAANAAKTITYLVDKKWDGKAFLNGKNDIAALTFAAVPVEPAKPKP